MSRIPCKVWGVSNLTRPKYVVECVPNYYVWGMSKYTPRTLDWLRIQYRVWGVSKLTHPKPKVGYVPKYGFEVYQNTHPEYMFGHSYVKFGACQI